MNDLIDFIAGQPGSQVSHQEIAQDARNLLALGREKFYSPPFDIFCCFRNEFIRNLSRLKIKGSIGSELVMCTSREILKSIRK